MNKVLSILTIPLLLLGVCMIIFKDALFIEIDNSIAYSAVNQINDENLTRLGTTFSNKTKYLYYAYQILTLVFILAPLTIKTFLNNKSK